MRVHVVGNRRSPEVLAWLTEADHETVELTASSMAESIDAIRDAIVNDQAERIVVIGGDGMVHAAVNAIAPLGSQAAEIVLGVVPLGSGNDVARALGLPIDKPVEAAKRALGAATPIDLLHTTHGWVASVATCGFPGRVTERANQMRWPKGSAKYSVATVMLMPSLASDHLSITLDDMPPKSVDLSIFAVGNTAWFGGGMKICPDAQPTDGTAEVIQVHRVGRIEMLRYLPTVFSGQHVHHRQTERCIATRVTIEGAHSIGLWGDGELLGPLPVDINVVPKAIRVAGFNPRGT
jgi:diacylglycerol kinase (ATP)